MDLLQDNRRNRIVNTITYCYPVLSCDPVIFYSCMSASGFFAGVETRMDHQIPGEEDEDAAEQGDE